MSHSAVLLRSLVVAGGLGLLVGGWWALRPSNEQIARHSFELHRADYVRFATLLEQHHGDRYIGSDGTAVDGSGKPRLDQDYSGMMRKIDAKFVTVREDGSAEFALSGFGCTICSDSYFGVRYQPSRRSSSDPGWAAQSVESLSDKDLPHNGGSIADGLYVVNIAPEWFVYRFEYRE